MKSRIFRKFGPTVEGWGMTELSPSGTGTPPKNEVLGSCGVLLSNTEAKFVDLTTGKSLGPKEQGELCIRGPQVGIRESHGYS